MSHALSLSSVRSNGLVTYNTLHLINLSLFKVEFRDTAWEPCGVHKCTVTEDHLFFFFNWGGYLPEKKNDVTQTETYRLLSLSTILLLPARFLNYVGYPVEHFIRRKKRKDYYIEKGYYSVFYHAGELTGGIIHPSHSWIAGRALSKLLSARDVVLRQEKSITGDTGALFTVCKEMPGHLRIKKIPLQGCFLPCYGQTHIGLQGVPPSCASVILVGSLCMGCLLKKKYRSALAHRPQVYPTVDPT